jgi:hypothetical protein
MENEVFMYVSVISGIFGLLSIYMLNRNWFKRQELKSNLAMQEMGYKYKIDKKKIKLKEAQTLQTPLDAITGKGTNLAKFLPLLTELDPDTLMELKDIFLGGGSVKDVPKGVLSEILDVVPPEVIQEFIGGFVEGKGKQKNLVGFEG